MTLTLNPSDPINVLLQEVLAYSGETHLVCEGMQGRGQAPLF